MINPQMVLQDIESANFQEKKILALLGKCLKKLSFKSSTDLENLHGLAKWLYIYGYVEHALQVCQIINDVSFANNFNIWSPIEGLLLLEARIYREQQDDEKAQAIIGKVVRPMLPHQDAFRRRLSFDWLHDKALTRYLTENNARMANNVRFADLSNLFFIRELGDGLTDLHGNAVDIANAEERILEYIQILKQVKDK